MGIVNLYKGLESEREILNFTGKLKDNLDLDWDHVKIIKNGQELTADYVLQENEVLIIQELPGAPVAIVAIAVIAITAIGVAGYSYLQAKKAQREMEEALKRIGKNNKQKDVTSIPQLADARNEKIDGKNVPIILGKHLFAPYFLSEPYMRPAGEDGEDLYWYGSFLVGQDGLCFEKIRNGSIDLVTLSGDTPQRDRIPFDVPENYNPEAEGFTPPPFYDPKNFIELVQKGNNDTVNSFTEERFEQKWVDSLDSSVELGRKPKDNAGTVNGIFTDDAGEEPVIRPTARFPMRAEIEIMFDGLYGWDSKHGKETEATVDVQLEWSKDQNSWTPFSGTQWAYRNLERAKSKQMRFLAEIDFDASVYTKDGSPVYIRATRMTKMHSGSYRDRVYLSAIRTQQYNPQESSDRELVAAKNINNRVADKFCRLGIKIKANKNTQEFLDRFNVIASMTGRTWDNGWSTVKTKTSNSAAVLLELITGLIHDTSKHKDNELDYKIVGNNRITAYTFGKLYEYCASRSVTIAGQGRQTLTLECNGVLTSGTRKIDAIQSILATCDAGLYVNEFGKLEVYYENYQETPIALLNNQRLISMVDHRSLERKSDGYAVEFVDWEADWTQKTHRILRPRVEVNPGLNTYSPMKLDFTTSYNQAMWHARRLLAKEEFRPGEIKCTVGKEGRYYKPGSLIKVQNERHKIGLGSGEIIQLIRNGNQITGLKLMEHFDISRDRDYWIEYYVVDEDRNFVADSQTVNGVRQKGIKIQSVGEYTDRLMFTVPMDADDPNLPAFMNPLSVMYGERLNQVQVQEAKRYIVTDLSENQNGYDLSLAEYAKEIYNDSEIEDIPERQSSILSAPPMVFSDQQRNEQQLILDALREQTNPKNIDWIASQVFDREIGGAVGAITPRYRGTAYNLDNTGMIGSNKMNIGDRVMYLGNQGGYITNRIYRWTGSDWEMLSFPTSGDGRNALYYLEAIDDTTSGAPEAVFSYAQIKSIVASSIFADLIGAKEIILNEGGSISGNYLSGVSGFIIKSDGDAEFNDGTFRGLLQARYIRVTGDVSSGTQYILRSNNTLSIIDSYGGSWIAATFDAVAKEIRTLAHGSCTVRLRFPTVASASMNNRNVGSYKIVVNDTIIVDWTNYSTNVDIDIPNVPLPNEVNVVKLYGAPSTAGNITSFGFYNSIFELRCNQDPAFLAMIG